MPAPLVPFGKQFREKYFTAFEEGITPVNNGSYGTAPDPVLEEYINAVKHEAKYPDRYVLFEQQPQFSNSLKAAATLLNTEYTNLAFVDNATTAANTILRSFPFKKGDKIVYLSTIYGSCGNTIKFLEKSIGVVGIKIEIGYPINDAELVSKFEEVFKAEKPRLAFFDTVCSMPGIKLPFVELTKLAKKYDVLTFVDGAHSAGLIPIDLDSLKPDFYCSNLHKWYYVPSGCSVLYVDKKHHRNIHTMPISHSYLDSSVELEPSLEKTRLVDRFAFTGTKKFASIAAIPAAVKFREEVCGGEEEIMKYCNGLSLEVGKYVSERWGTSYLDNETHDAITAMVTVEIPSEKLGLNLAVLQPKWSQVLNYVYGKMFFEHKTYVPIVLHNNKLWCRFSCQTYNDLDDYKYASKCLFEVLNELAADSLNKSD